MRKKGQITLFIIVGLVLLIGGFSLIFILKTNLIKSQDEKVGESSQIKNYVEKCLEEISLDGIYLLGMQGGYIYTEKRLFYNENITVAYHYYEGDDFTPTIRDMEDDISLYVKNNMYKCLNNFSALREKNMDVSDGVMKPETIVGEKEVIVKLNYPITFTEKDKKTTVKEFTATLPIRLGYINGVVKQIAAMEVNDPEWMDYKLITSFDVKINLWYLKENNLLYQITDEKSGTSERGIYRFYTISKFKI